MTVRVGLIGCGIMGRAHLPGYRAVGQRAALMMCCDTDEVLAREHAAEAGPDTAFTTRWQDIIENPAVDAVDICTPHFLHLPMVLAAARAGKHILLEKPMAMNLDEGRTMVEAAGASGKIFMVGQNHRYLPEHGRVKDLLNQNAIGRVIAARIDGNQFLSRAYPPGHWLFSKTLAGGGVIRTTAIHKVDMLRYFIGEIRRVNAMYATSGLNPGMNSEDIAAFNMQFENGAIGEAFFTFAAHQGPLPGTGELVVLYGTHGLLSNAGGWQLYSTTMEPYSQKMTPLDIPPSDYYESFTHEIDHFIHCIETGQEPLSSARDNLHTIAVVDALYRAAETAMTLPVETF